MYSPFEKMFIRCPEPGASPPGALQLSHPALESSTHTARHKYGVRPCPMWCQKAIKPPGPTVIIANQISLGNLLGWCKGDGSRM